MGNVWSSLKQDVGYAARIFSRSPGFTAIAIATLALGIGATTAIFSIVDAVLLKPLPFREPARLVAVWERAFQEKDVSKLFDIYRDLEIYRKNSRSFEAIAGATWAVSGRILTGHGQARSTLMVAATADFFHVLGVAPELGRAFGAEDLNRACTVVLEHRFWQGVLGGDPKIVGQNLRLDDLTCTVAGVMPSKFVFYPDQASMWMLLTPAHPIARDPDRNGVGIFARLKPGVTAQAAQEELRRLHANAHASDRHGKLAEPVVYPLRDEFTWLAGRNLRLSIILLFGAVCLVLLIACVNVANLSLGRALARQREFAVRAALGSGKWRLLRQLLTESLLLSSVAAVLGLAIAAGAVAYFRVRNPIDLPPGTPIMVNGEVLAFTAFLSVFTSLLFGMAPAWRASRADITESLKANGRGASQDARKLWFAKGLVVGEIAFSLVLLVGAGLLIQSVSKFSSVPLGFNPERLLTMSMAMPRTVFGKAESRTRFYDELMQAVRTMPEIRSAALATSPPAQSAPASSALLVSGRPDPAASAALYDVAQIGASSGYFRVLEIPVRAGRTFDERDRPGSEPVAVVNEALVRKYFPGEDPIGRQIRFFGEPEAANPWLTVVGITADEKRGGLAEMTWKESPTVYKALEQRPPGGAQLILRVGSERTAVGAAVQRKIAELNPNISVTSVSSGEKLVAQSTAYPKFRAVLLGAFSALAVLLAAVGLYGVLAQLVSRRTQEIGVRMALGASRGDVLKMILGEGLLLAVVGLAFGLAATWWLSKFLASLLYGVRATDPATLALSSAGLLIAALLATYIPVQRAMRVDPAVALRDE